MAWVEPPVMLGSAVPIGIDLNSPLAWVLIAVALIVLALTISTRRSNVRPRPSRPGPPAAPPPPTPPPPPIAPADWAAAQALFGEDPRAGCERARTIVTRAMRERGLSFERPELLDRRYLLGCGLAAEPDASTDDLRTAFRNFRAAFDELVATSGPAVVRGAGDEQA